MSDVSSRTSVEVPHDTLARVLPLGWACVAAIGSLEAALGAYAAAAISVFVALVVLPAAYLLARRRVEVAAKFAVLIALNLAVLSGQVLLGRFAGFVFFFTPLAVLSALLFKSGQTKHIAGGAAIALLSWLVGEAAFVHDLAAPFVPHPIPQAPLHFVNFLIGFGLTLLFARVYLNTIRRIDGARVAAAEAASIELRLIFDSMIEGVVIQDAEGKIHKMNKAAAHILGVAESADRLRYGTEMEVFDESGRLLSLSELPVRTALRTGLPQLGVNLRIARADDTTRWLRVNATPVVNAAGTYAVTTFADVTDQRDSLNLLHQIVNGTPDFIFIKDRAHRYLTCNDSYAEALGRVPADVIGRTDDELGFCETRVREFHESANRIFASGHVQSAEAGVMRLGGKAREFHTVKVPLFNGDQAEAYGVLTFARDITQLKDAERRLTEASKMASLGHMAGGIAHEINNPLAIISGRVESLSRRIAREDFDRAAAEAGLRSIASTVERIAKIIRGLKSFSRQADDDPFEVISLKTVVEDSLAFCRERFAANGVQLTVDDVPDARVLGSAVQLSQVLINLLNNAYDAVEPGNAKWIRVGFAEPAAGRVAIEVTDGGPAIPDEVADKLMNPFFTTKTVGKGTGLGLTLSHEIAQRHGGALYLDRAALTTRFVIDLPRHAGTGYDLNDRRAS